MGDSVKLGGRAEPGGRRRSLERPAFSVRGQTKVRGWDWRRGSRGELVSRLPSVGVLVRRQRGVGGQGAVGSAPWKPDSSKRSQRKVKPPVRTLKAMWVESCW